MLRKSLPGVWNKYENLLVWINIRKRLLLIIN
jgi:hypothetical protein